ALSLLLPPLPDREAEQLVVHLLGGKVDQAVQVHLNGWAQGFPLLVEEVVSNLGEEGQLRKVDGSWTLWVASEEATVRRARPVPTSIHAVQQARPNRLQPHHRAAIQPA